MRQAQNKKEKDKIAIALVLAFCVIALTSIFTLKSNIDKINESGENTDLPVSEGTRAEEETLPQEQEAENSAEASAGIPTVDSLSPQAQAQPADWLHPVNSPDAAVTNPYSMDKLIYSVTLDQYMTHCGVDIEASAGTQVVAAAEGTVTAVYNDDRYGSSIEITHPGEVITIYSNLAESSELVETGDVVEAGQIIAGVGSTGLFESLEPAHLHFEMLVGGAYVNPADYIAF